MSAAAPAAAPRKKRAHSEKWRAYVDPIIIRHLPQCVTPVEAFLLQNILLETIYGPRKLEWVTADLETMAGWIGVSADGIFKALRLLEQRELIRSEKDGKSRKYKAILKNIERLEPRQPAEVAKEQKEPTAVKQRHRSVITMSKGNRSPLTLAEPVQTIDMKSLLEDNVDVTADLRGSVLSLSFSIGKAVGNVRTPVRTSGKETVETKALAVRKVFEVPPPASKVNGLQAYLTPVFMSLFSVPPDEKILDAIRSKLGDTPLEEFERVVRARLARRGKITPGLFPYLAQDAVDAFTAQAAKAPPPHSDTAAPSFFSAEPLDSKSEWSRIRQRVQKRVTEQVYTNWFELTRQVSVEGGLLRVATPDQVTAAMLNEEYGPEIQAAIEAVDAQCVTVEFFPEGEE